MPRTTDGHLFCEVCEEVVPALNVVQGHFHCPPDILRTRIGVHTIELCDVCLEAAPDQGFVFDEVCCECEHISHFDSGPDHPFFAETNDGFVRVKGQVGNTFYCKACARGHMAAYLPTQGVTDETGADWSPRADS